jgi:hypothetical protein
LNDKTFKKALKYKGEFHIFENFDYYVKEIHRFNPLEYNLTFDDILHSQKKTIGVWEIDCIEKKKNIKIVECGAHRGERKVKNKLKLENN